MNFEDFRKDIELKLGSIAEFELQEFHFLPYSFGSGILVYRIDGQDHKFVFDGRENELIWLKRRTHQKYTQSDFTQFEKFEGLKICEKELQNGIKNSA